MLISAEEIQSRLDELARELSEIYRGKPFTIVGILTGCLIFLSDLIRRLDFPLKLILIEASSYRGDATTSGELTVQPRTLPDLTGRHILLLDDILDTGRTLRRVADDLHAHGVASLRIAALLHKPARQVVPLKADFIGFTIPDEFVVGYGLDYNDEYRNLPYIGALPPQG